MSLISLIITSLLIFLLGFLPGRILLINLALEHEEKFAVSFGLSFLLFYLLGFAGFILNCNLYFALFIVILFFRKFPLKYSEIRNLLGFFAFFLLLVSFQGLLTSYNNGIWYFDWLEHYQRSLFFLERPIVLNRYFGPYLLTSRPPFFNVVTSFFLALFGRDFWTYQLTSTLLNSVIILPVCLLAKNIFKIKIPALFLLISAILLLNPVFITQITYTWTRSLTAYYLLLGLYFYLKARFDKKSLNFYLSSLSLGSAWITHYSAVPFILIIFTDFTIRLLTKKVSLKIFLPSLLFFLLIISTWYVWAVQNFGIYQTFLGNTAYEWQKDFTLTQKINAITANLNYTLNPLLDKDYIRIVSAQKNQLVRFYDLIFGFYASKLAGNITLTLSLILIYQSTVYFIKNRLRLTRHLFLIAFILLGTVLATMSVTFPHLPGIAHIMLLPATLLLIITAVKYLEELKHQGQKLLLLLVLCGMILESILGIGLKLYLSQNDLNPAKLAQNSLIPVHYNNINLKNENSLKFISDEFSSLQPFFLTVIIAAWLLGISILFKIFLQPFREKTSV